jgi:TatD DNase family protein
VIISFTGTVTFGKNHNESVLKAIDLKDFMLETDCPFLAPIPNRGKLNEPANIPHIAQQIAEIIGVSVEEVAEKTTRTAQQFFRLPA